MKLVITSDTHGQSHGRELPDGDIHEIWIHYIAREGGNWEDNLVATAGREIDSYEVEELGT